MIRLACGLYRALLFALPPAHRRVFGPAMAAAFRDACRGAARQGRHGVMRATCGAAADLLRQAPREWVAEARAATALRRAVTQASIRPTNPAPPGEAHMLDSLLSDVRHAFRGMRSSPGYAAVVIATMAVGIGASTAIFSVVRGVLLEPLPYPEPERIVTIAEITPEIDIPPMWVSIPNWADYRDGVEAIGDLSLFRGRSMSITEDDDPIYVYGAFVTAGFFRVFGAGAVDGRTFTADEGGPQPEPVVVLGHDLWTRRFGGDRSIVGRAVEIDGVPRTVVGIMPAGFDAPGEWIGPGVRVELWQPYAVDVAAEGRINRSSHAVGRLVDGATFEQARTQLDALSSRLQEDYPEANRNWSAHLYRWHDLLIGDVRTAMNLLWVVVTFVLVVACANVANLHLARLLHRRHDIAVRKALGASRRRLLQGSIAESLVLALLGGALGVGLAAASLRAFLYFEPGDLPLTQRIEIDGAVLLVTLAISVSTGLLFGAVPGLLVMRQTVRAAVQHGDGRTVAGGRHPARTAMVAAQVALAFAVAIAATLVGQSFARLSAVPSGIDADRVMTATVALSWDRVSTLAERSQFIRGVLERIEEIPGVESAAAINSLPFSGSNSWSVVWIDGTPAADPSRQPVAAFRNVTARYLQTMGIPIVRGRPLDEADMQEVTAAVINESFAASYFARLDPIGRVLGLEDGEITVRVVGVAADVHHFGLDAAPRPEIYLPYTRDWLTSKTFVARAAGDPELIAAAMREAIVAADPDQPLRDLHSMREVIAATTAGPRFNALAMGLAAVIAVGLATLGLFGTISYMVAERTRELGIRLALGGTPARVIGRVLGYGTALAGIGVLAGVLLALAGSRALQGLLFEVTATDPASYALVAILFVFAAALASYLPARRASRVDPVIVMRQR
jgi:putative ABC transport system permease protein